MSWAGALASIVRSEIRSLHALAGGDINDAHAVELADGRKLFVKTCVGAPVAMYAREASGLRWLEDAQALRVPEVIAVHESFLAMELISPGPRAARYDEELGRGLAMLHRAGAPSFGFREDNFVGSLPQGNDPSDDWAQFYGQRRLRAQLDIAGRRADRLRDRMDRLIAKLPELVGPSEPPSRLHGDLWGGNVHTDERGAPVLIDPAVYGGNREIDLAMLQLFGGISATMLAAYDEAYPLEKAWRDRVSLYQLYPLLVHLNLFGGGYLASAERVLDRYV